MKKAGKISLGVLAGVVILLISLIVINNYAESRIKKAIEGNLKKINASFTEVDVNLLRRNAQIIDPQINFKGKTLKVDTIQLTQIQIWDYIKDKKLIAGNLKISNPVVKIYNFKHEKDTTQNSGTPEFKKDILLKNVSVNGGSFQIFEKDSTNHRLYTKLRSIKMDEVRINSNTVKEAVPFDYDLILLKSDSIFYDLNAQQKMTLRDLQIENNKVTIKTFKLAPKYSKAEHQKTTKVEKDRYDLTIDEISMDSFTWNSDRDTIAIRNGFTELKRARLDIYRNKLKPDDLSPKPLYSEMLRKLPVKIALDSIRITKSNIKYEENIHADRETGVVEFSNLNANISNLTNIGLERKDFPKIRIRVNTDFMKSAPLSVDWSFNVSDPGDRFQISGQMGNLAAEEMNRFLKPAMNVQAKGEILNMYFNFAGNDDSASGDMKLEYKDFKVEVLKKDGSSKNKLVSTLANLIVSNKALNKKADYKEISVSRDKTRSFWNYLWKMIKSGALKAFL
ncbi:hypothetical protein [Christiangramia salexigens]|uniref:DUF748 domain-containing protein n=1 Tax=Christiangramia salexigens TaxID=1913577 RepID=A0A1L3J5P3_9FLAO|nr:hypothetical protein [Christiangramia salexigens]APG60414.1 hypothetical protein LPB144_08345 [Christiangramia salexigens]